MAVVYDVGGTPLEIARGVEGVADLVFVVQGSAHSASVRELLEQVAPVIDATSVAETAQALMEHGCDGVVTYSEPALPLTSALGEALRVHARETVECVTDKSLQRNRLRECGVDAVWSDSVPSRDALVVRVDDLPYPVIIKPRVGGASRAVAQLDDRDDLRAG